MSATWGMQKGDLFALTNTPELLSKLKRAYVVSVNTHKKLIQPHLIVEALIQVESTKREMRFFRVFENDSLSFVVLKPKAIKKGEPLLDNPESKSYRATKNYHHGLLTVKLADVDHAYYAWVSTQELDNSFILQRRNGGG